MDLMKIEAEAIDAMTKGEWKKSHDLWKAIIAERYDWEHGEALYHFAICLEELKLFEDARSAYEAALEIEPKNTYYLGGFASFLSKWGSPQEAYKVHLDYLRATPTLQDIRECLPALEGLAQKIGTTMVEVNGDLKRINQAWANE